MHRTASCNIHQTKCSHQDLQANGHRLIVPDHVLNKIGGYGDYSPLKSSLMIKHSYTQNHSAPRIWSIFHCHWPWMLHTIVNNNACQSSLESFPNSFSIQVDQKVAKYSLKFWDWPKGRSTLWKRPSNNTTCYCDTSYLPRSVVTIEYSTVTHIHKQPTSQRGWLQSQPTRPGHQLQAEQCATIGEVLVIKKNFKKHFNCVITNIQIQEKNWT